VLRNGGDELLAVLRIVGEGCQELGSALAVPTACGEVGTR